MTAHPYITGIDPCGYIAGEKRSRWPDFWGGNQFSNRERRIRMRRRRGRYRGKLINVHDEHREQIRRNGEKMKKIFIIIGFVLFVLLGVIMKQSINKNMVAINLYYDEVKENTSPEESKKQMEIYLKNHRKKYLIKDIVY